MAARVVEAVRIPLRARDGSVRAWATVDAADLDELNQWRWSLAPEGYARRGKVVNGQHTHIKMHRQLLGLERFDERQGDHINGVRLDNRRSNLRIVTMRENTLNRRSYVGSTSRFRGVGWQKTRKRWVARVKVDGKDIYLGSFIDEVEAAEAARVGRLKHLGEIAA